MLNTVEVGDRIKSVIGFFAPPFQVSDLRFFGMGKDKTKSNLEESYEQANVDQTTMIMENQTESKAALWQANF